MLNDSQISALLAVCVLPAVVKEIVKLHNNDEQSTIKHFFASALFSKIHDTKTGLWYLSAKTLASMYEQEIKYQKIEYPDEQS